MSKRKLANLFVDREGRLRPSPRICLAELTSLELLDRRIVEPRPRRADPGAGRLTAAGGHVAPLHPGTYLRGDLLRGQAGRDQTGRPPPGGTFSGTADEASAQTVTVRPIWTDRTGRSN